MTDSKDETIQSNNKNSDVENIQENDVDTGTSSSKNEEKSADDFFFRASLDYQIK